MADECTVQERMVQFMESRGCGVVLGGRQASRGGHQSGSSDAEEVERSRQASGEAVAVESERRKVICEYQVLAEGREHGHCPNGVNTRWKRRKGITPHL